VPITGFFGVFLTLTLNPDVLASELLGASDVAKGGCQHLVAATGGNSSK